MRYNTWVDYFVSTALADLMGEAKLRNYPKGQIVLYDGDAPTDLYLIKKGIVKVYDIDNSGNEKILHILKAPSAFPMLLFMKVVEETQSFYTTLTDAEIYSVPISFVQEQIHKNASLSTELMYRFGVEIHELLVRLSSLEKSTTSDKLIAALKFLAVHHAEERRSGWRRVIFPVSHQLLADLIGVTRESTTMVMKDLQIKKIVRNPRLTVLEINFPRLIEL